MNKFLIALFGGGGMACALAAGYFFSEGNALRGMLFAVLALGLALLMLSKMFGREHKTDLTPQSAEPPAINPAFYGELSRLIDEGKDINGYLRECDPPNNIVKSVNIGGATRWYYHKDGLKYNEFAAELPHGEEAEFEHPYVLDRRVEAGEETDTHIITVDLYRVLWDWGDKHPGMHRYANSMRIAYHGAYKPDEEGDTSILNKTIEEVRAERKANKKKPKKQRRSAGL